MRLKCALVGMLLLVALPCEVGARASASHVPPEDELPSQSGIRSDPLDGWWRILKVGSGVVPQSAGRGTYVVFHHRELTGSDGCNGFWGNYTLSGAALKITDLGQTTVACRRPGDPDLDARATAILRLLRDANRVRVRADKVTLIADGREVLQLHRAPSADRIRPLPLGGGETVDILSDPQWSQRPSQETIERLLAEQRRYSRSMQVLCATQPGGELSDCRVLFPSRGMQGFDQAVLSLAARYRLSPPDARLAHSTHASIIIEVEI